MKKKVFMAFIILALASCFVGCGANKEVQTTAAEQETEIEVSENPDQDIPDKIGAGDIDDQTPATDTIENADDSAAANGENLPEDTAETPEEDLSGLPFIELQPILDNLDDVWGKNWQEWTVEEFRKLPGVVPENLQESGEYAYGPGVRHAYVNPDGGMSINEDGQCDAIYDVKSIGVYWNVDHYVRQYNRIIWFPGEMAEDPMSTYFKTCEGCLTNDCSKCRNIDCEGCNNKKCLDEDVAKSDETDVKQCDDCLLLDCTRILKYWGFDEDCFKESDYSCDVGTEYGKARLVISHFEDSIQIKFFDFSKQKHLEVEFSDGYALAAFPKLFIAVIDDDLMSKDIANEGNASESSSGANTDASIGTQERVFGSPYAKYNAEDEKTIEELRSFLVDNGLQTKFYTMYSTWQQLFNESGEELSEQQWIERFGLYLTEEEYN